MKKKTLARLLDQANRSVAAMIDRETNRREALKQEFEEALAELRGPVEVRIITPSGRIVEAKMIEMQLETEAVEVTNPQIDRWREFLPGRRTVELRLAPYPGK